MHSYRRFEIRPGDTDDVILVKNRSDTSVSPALSAEKLVTALLFERCGIIQGSSLLDFITF
jgi:hypothetical protein